MEKLAIVSLALLVACTGDDGVMESVDDGLTSSTGVVDPTGSSTAVSGADSSSGEDTTATAESSTGTPNDNDSESDGGSSEGGSGTDTDGGSGTDGGSTGGVVEPSDADAVDWPPGCATIAAQPVVCLAFGDVGFDDTEIVALNLDTGAACTLQSVPGMFWDMPGTMAWIGDKLAYPSSDWVYGGVVDLNTGERVELPPAFTNLGMFEWEDGVIIDNNAGLNATYFESTEALESNTITETYALGDIQYRGFTVGDVLHSYSSGFTQPTAVDIVTGTPVNAIILDNPPPWADGLTATDDTIFVLHDEVVSSYDLEGTLVASQPIASGFLRGLACSPGVTQ